LGYGNLGKGVELAVKEAPDMELCAVFTRREPSSLKIQTENIPVVSVNDVADWKDKIDVMILCGGSATDLPVQTPEYAKLFNVVDSFDTHARIPEHFANVDKAAKEAGNIAVISCGWDPGMFSIARVYGSAILPDGNDYTFWGKGVSQGHSDAIRRIDGCPRKNVGANKRGACNKVCAMGAIGAIAIFACHTIYLVTSLGDNIYHSSKSHIAIE
jgi:diaminopimelate dehydrogenase